MPQGGRDRSPRLVVTSEGRAVSRDQPLLHADDLGVLRGDGLFESLLVIEGMPEFLDEHLARMARSAAVMDLPLPPAVEWQRGVAAAIEAWTGGPEIALHLIVTRGTERGPTWYVLADPVSKQIMARRRDGVSALTVERGLDPEATDRAPWLLMGAKLLSYAVNMAAQRWAHAHDADDAIFVALGGAILEGTTSAVVIARDRKLLSPPRSLGILPSITLSFERLTDADLYDADGVWLLSSILKVARLHTLNGTPLPDTGLHDQICRLIGSIPGRMT